MNKKILFIGGSPCSGKSTIAEMISNDFIACYFKVDDYLDEFVKKAAEQGLPACKRVLEMSADEIWMRDPVLQCEEEFSIYEEIGELVFNKLNSIEEELIITEAAAYIPKIMEKIGNKNYICLIPSPDFQISHYRQREWINIVLKDCQDKEKAFDNWMQRDILFAKKVFEQCNQKRIPCIVNDGTRTINEIYEIVKENLKIVK